MSIIRHASAEAVTTDGLHWEIYVSSARVGAMLRRSQPEQVSPEEQAIPTWYLELGENQKDR